MINSTLANTDVNLISQNLFIVILSYGAYK